MLNDELSGITKYSLQYCIDVLVSCNRSIASKILVYYALLSIPFLLLV